MNTQQIPLRVTPEQVENAISHCYYVTGHEAVSRYYYVGEEPRKNIELLTLCILVLANGYTVVGKSACVDPNAFDALKGRELAFEDAVSQVYPLLAFMLKTDLYDQEIEEELVKVLEEILDQERT